MHLKRVHDKTVGVIGVIAFLGAVTLGMTSAFSAEPPLTGDRIAAKDGDIIIHPINHATLAIGWKDHVLYVDPVGGASRYQGLPKPDLILITDIHQDHLSLDTLKAVATEKTAFIVPRAVSDQLPKDWPTRATIETDNPIKKDWIQIEAVPAYNIAPEREKYHAKGRGIGYLLTLAGKRIYISGDTEDIPEMRALKDIDVAFLCMNLPYTMKVEQAADAVRAFRPKIVYPYHSRGSDLEKFKTLVGKDAGVEVRLREWYK